MVIIRSAITFIKRKKGIQQLRISGVFSLSAIPIIVIGGLKNPNRIFSYFKSVWFKLNSFFYLLKSFGTTRKLKKSKKHILLDGF